MFRTSVVNRSGGGYFEEVEAMKNWIEKRFQWFRKEFNK